MTEFMELSKTEDNIIRIVSSPYVYFKDRYDLDDKRCERCDCCFFDIGIVGIIDFKVKKYKLLNLTHCMFHQIRQYAQNEKWGDPTKYNLNINYTNYSKLILNDWLVFGMPSQPLSASYQQLVKEKCDLDELKSLVLPP